MLNFGKKRCDLCDTKYPKNTSFHELRLQVEDGTTELEICSRCADFFDKSADVLTKGRKNDGDEDE